MNKKDDTLEPSPETTESAELPQPKDDTAPKTETEETETEMVYGFPRAKRVKRT